MFNPMKKALLFLTTGLFLAQSETITITQKASGKTLLVTPTEVSGSDVSFSYNGKAFTVPAESLTEESVTLLKNALAEAPPVESRSKNSEGFEKVNKAAGHELFAGKALWSEKAEDIAKRLKWRTESQKKNSSSYRLYPKPEYTFFGARPYCVTLYGGANDTPERLSFVFANKGDYGSKLGSGEDHFKIVNPDIEPPTDLASAIRIDEEIIEAKLTSALGEPESQYYGEKEDKRKVKRWDVGDQSFLLSAKKEEYVHLLVVSKENADKEGKIKFVKDATLKASHQNNIVRKDNGDVWIDNIPMVDQGPKGYWAPATFERAMRYMNVPADMYLLATSATAAGGGTNTSKLADDAKRIVRSKARRIKDISFGNSGLKPRDVKSYIDKGVPVLWQMRSLKKYSDIASNRTKEREKVSDWTQWAETIQKEADSVIASLGINDRHHI